jgi:two-component system, OmpR family, KDP operon response regulator KdpE
MSQGGGARILVVDDEPEIVRALRTNLTRHGFHVDSAHGGLEALDSYARRRPDLVVLDLGLPDLNGVEVIRELRGRGNTPVVVLSARGGERDKIAALDLGADDYVTKPFSMGELMARIRVALRHSARPGSGAEAVFRTADLSVDFEKRAVRVGEMDVHLTPTEYELLKVLVTHPNKLLTNRILLQLIWGPEYGSETHYLHVYVAQLRQKLGDDPQDPHYIFTEPGVGYRFLSETG